jgi:formylglycine-generating enzyme required for sulfatase activity
MMRKLLLVFCLVVLWSQSSLAFQPSGWVYCNYPWAYDQGSSDWYWFNTADTQWVCNMGSGQWTTLDQSPLASGWFYYANGYAYASGNQTWYYVNAADTQWVVNMRTDNWSRFGEEVVGTDYLVIDLSEGPLATNYPVSYLGSPPEGGWTDEYKTTKLVMRYVQASTFSMGSPTNELGRYSDKETQRQVTLTQNYYIGVFEVTQRQWERVMGDWPSYYTNSLYRETRPVEQVSYFDIREDADNNLAISTNWPQSTEVGANSFIGKLRDKTGLLTFDLPTEAQWELATRAGTTTALNSGRDLCASTQCTYLDPLARYYYTGGMDDPSYGTTDVGTAKVGSYLPNAWGLYDTHGNLWEWSLDWFEDYHSPTTDPVGPETGSYRSVRGGGWHNNARDCRSASRGGFYHPGTQYYRVGFRICRTLP